MSLSDFDYILPGELIAKTPARPRDHSRLMVIHRSTQKIEHRRFFELGDYLAAGDLLVRNTTKVLPARLFGETAFGGQVEIVLLRRQPGTAEVWECLCRPGRKVRDGLKLTFPEGGMATVTRPDDSGVFQISFEKWGDRQFLEWLFAAGVAPLPPYLNREATSDDKQDYQTVFAREPGSVAAPTAGLHFTIPLIEKLQAQRIKFADVTLHVSYGTFAPLREESFTERALHHEYYCIPESTLAAVNETRANRKKVIPVGTTSLRSLESYSRFGREGETTLFLQPGDSLTLCDGLLTNFHLPQTSLLVLVSTLLGKQLTQTAYRTAIEERYRFYSYGDAMLIL